jgi:parallel beta-helix repeat protein
MTGRVSGLIAAGLLCFLAPLGADAANPACGATISGVVTLTGNMNCTAVKKHGLALTSGTTLDCAGFSILGPDSTVANGVQTGRFGVYASNKTGITIKNCTVTDYDRGLYFSNVSNSVVNHSRFHGNTRFGASVAGSGSFGVLFDACTFEGNGDEGLHFGGPFNNGAANPNRVTHSVAANNVAEGFYLLNANNVELDMNTASGNTAGLYVKQSPNVVVSHLTVIGDYVHLYGNSDGGRYSWISITGGRLKLQKDTGTNGVPSANTFDHVCVSYDPASAAPDSAYYFEGVTSGANQFTNSAAKLVAGKTHVTAVASSTGNIMSSLYIQPAALRTSIDGTSSFASLTAQSTSAPLCY